MAPRAEDEHPDPPSGDVPGDDDGSPGLPGQDPTSLTPDAQWDQIVARLADLDAIDAAPPARPVRPARPADDDRSDHGHPDRDQADRDRWTDEGPGRILSGRDWDGTEAMDAAERQVDEDEHFVPTDPGPVLGGDPLTTMGWFAVVGMPVLWLVVLLGWRSAPPVLLQASAAVFVAGLAVLVWRMPHRRDPDDDDGAQV